VVNPRTGRPAEYLRSVTVVGPDLAVADAYATAGVAMGAAGLAWLAALPGRAQPEPGFGGGEHAPDGSGYQVAVVTEDGQGFCSPGLPAVPIEPGEVTAVSAP
jgi:FAD:protein FMN transferase